MSLLITFFRQLSLVFPFAPSWMCTVKCPFFVTMYYFQPWCLAKFFHSNPVDRFWTTAAIVSIEGNVPTSIPHLM